MVVAELDRAGYLQNYVNPLRLDNMGALGAVQLTERTLMHIGFTNRDLQFDRDLIDRKLKNSRTAINYLDTFGYLDAVINQKRNERVPKASGPEVASIVMLKVPIIEGALKLFQHLNGLPETGVVDMNVMALMRVPRCGMPDVHPDHFKNNRVKRDSGVYVDYNKRYAKSDEKWEKDKLTFYIQNHSSTLGHVETEKELIRAFEVWAKHVPLKLYQVQNMSVADISIRFVSKDHGDKYPFDGPMGILAHAFYPRSGEVHFDDDEEFTSRVVRGVNLYYTAAHELGHTLGLKHSFHNRNSLMSPYHPGLQDVISLEDVDITAITKLYGGGKGTVYPTSSAAAQAYEATLLDELENNDNPAVKKPNCVTKIDAAMNDPFTKALYFFTQNVYYKVERDSQGELGVPSGYPKNISTGWDNLESDIDAAFTNKTTNAGYFFKGRKYWKYNFDTAKMFEDYPKNIPRTIPKNLKAVLSSGKRSYFFGQDALWKHKSGKAVLDLVKQKEPIIDSAYTLFVKGYFAITRNNTYSIFKARNLEAISGYQNRPLGWDYGLPMCKQDLTEWTHTLDHEKMMKLCEAYVVLAKEDYDVRIPRDCYKLLPVFHVKPLVDIEE